MINFIMIMMIAVLMNAPLIMIYLGMQLYYYTDYSLGRSTYTFRDSLSWSQLMCHVPNKLCYNQLSCRSGCCEYEVPKNVGAKSEG